MAFTYLSGNEGICKIPIADLKNISSVKGAGASTAATF